MIRRDELVKIEDVIARARLGQRGSVRARLALEAHLRENWESLRGFLVWGRAAMLSHGDLAPVWHESPVALRRAWSVSDVTCNCERIAAAITLLACARQHHASPSGSTCGDCEVGRANARTLTLPHRPERPR